MATIQTTTLSAAVGERMRELRDKAGRSADDVAHVAREHGLGWQRSTVAMVETARRGLTAEELLALPGIMHIVTGEPVSLADLLPQDRRAVSLAPGGWVSSDVLRRRVSGEAASGARTLGHREHFQEFTDHGRTQKAIRRAFGRDTTWEELDRLTEAVRRDAAGLAEQRAARRLGVDARTLAAFAHRLWGWSLTAERDRRVARGHAEQRSRQAIRGHITRELIAELEPVIQATRRRRR